MHLEFFFQITKTYEETQKGTNGKNLFIGNIEREREIVSIRGFQGQEESGLSTFGAGCLFGKM